jgi:hypothetical protein
MIICTEATPPRPRSGARSCFSPYLVTPWSSCAALFPAADSPARRWRWGAVLTSLGPAAPSPLAHAAWAVSPPGGLRCLRLDSGSCSSWEGCLWLLRSVRSAVASSAKPLQDCVGCCSPPTLLPLAARSLPTNARANTSELETTEPERTQGFCCTPSRCDGDLEFISPPRHLYLALCRPATSFKRLETLPTHWGDSSVPPGPTNQSHPSERKAARAPGPTPNQAAPARNLVARKPSLVCAQSQSSSTSAKKARWTRSTRTERMRCLHRQRIRPRTSVRSLLRGTARRHRPGPPTSLRSRRTARRRLVRLRPRLLPPATRLQLLQ